MEKAVESDGFRHLVGGDPLGSSNQTGLVPGQVFRTSHTTNPCPRTELQSISITALQFSMNRRPVVCYIIERTKPLASMHWVRELK